MATDTLVFAAASFAARTHRHQLRKDGVTPYAAHPFRVCLVVRHVFEVADPEVLAAALLHDTIEDTPTDRDEISERFGDHVAAWVAALTKDMRLSEGEREAAYLAALAAAPWQVHVCKLADIYDNLDDSLGLPGDTQQRTWRRARHYLDALETFLPPEAAQAFALVAEKLRVVSST